MFSSPPLSLSSVQQQFNLSGAKHHSQTTAMGEQGKMDALDPLQNQPCKVCGEPAAGFHFGAFTCEGCKSFFGRTCNNQSVIGECKNNYRCVVDKKNRTSCKACRLRKCMVVGMSKSGSRYGRRSNWFKIHCLMQQGGRKVAQPPYPASPQARPEHSLVPSLPWPPVTAVKTVSRSPSPLKVATSSPPASPSMASVLPSPTSLYPFQPSLPLPFVPTSSPFPFYRLSPLLASNPFLANSILFSMAGQKHAAAAAAGLNLLQEHRALLDTFSSAHLEPRERTNNNASPIDLSVRNDE